LTYKRNGGATIGGPHTPVAADHDAIGTVQAFAKLLNLREWNRL
jgi:hypothetical protein